MTTRPNPNATSNPALKQAAYEANGKPVSAEQFYALACDPARNVVVEACAGAGKTWMLVARMLRILLNPCAPEAILAMTFTKKAAAEMQMRLLELLRILACISPEERVATLKQHGLDSASAQTLQARAQGLYHALLESPVRVRTFHAWFAQLLSAAPMAFLQTLDLPSNYSLQEDTTVIQERTWPRFYAALQAPENTNEYVAYQALVNAYGRSTMQGLLQNALKRPAELSLVQGKAALTKALLSWQKVLGEAFAPWRDLTDLEQVLHLPTVQNSLQAACNVLAAHHTETAQAKAQDLEQALQASSWPTVQTALLTKDGTPRRRGFPENPVLQEAQALAQEALALQAQDKAYQLQTRMALLSRLLLTCYAQVKREHAWVDMGDLERAAHVLLQDVEISAWVQERLDASIRHILIDEFQDTSPLQWQTLLAWLSAYTGAGGGGDLRIFLVGDPKQSIYRFRGGQPEVFHAAKVFLQEPSWQATVLACDHTRRNAQSVLAAINGTMQAAQEQGEYQGFHSHSTQVVLDTEALQGVFYLPEIARPKSARKDQTTCLPWRDSLATPKYEEESALRTLEAEQAARTLAQMRAGSTSAQTIMVLARKRVALEAMALALRKIGIAAQMVEKSTLQEQAAVTDILALWDALLSPWHHLMLAQALKSPLFRLNDDQLLVLAHAAQKGSWWQALQAQHPAAHAQLERWKTLARHLPPYDILDTIYREADVRARYAAAVPSAQRVQVLQHLEALLQAALDIQGGRFLSGHSFLRALRQTPIKIATTPDSNAVQLLTIHGAKGLEADVVFLLDTQTKTNKKDSMSVLVQWPAERQEPTCFAFVESEASPPRGLQVVLKQELAARAREELNALYVALTRARCLLILSSVQTQSNTQTSWWQRVLPYAQIWTPPCAEGNIAATPAAENEPFALQCLPRRNPAAPVVHQSFKDLTLPPPPTASDINGHASRMGQAIHLILEWASEPSVAPVLSAKAKKQTNAAADMEAALSADLSTRFGLNVHDAQQTIVQARAIRNGAAAWVWDTQQLRFDANEVELRYQSRTLRIDRLVQRADDAVWWVLDYKSTQQPLAQAALLAQLQTYVAAVQAVNPNDTVQGAFITGQGQLVVLAS